MENVVDPVGDLSEGRAGSNGLPGDAVAAYGKGGDEREVGGSDQGGVAVQLLQFPGAYKDGSELQDGKSLSGSGRHRRLHIEEGDFGSFFTAQRTHFGLSKRRQES